jgi:crotonobetainyl-CoA:carnitine CoA-transferase CaiB-like acyl-CoA transferase
MNTPLADITVLDLGQIFQGPYATLLMAKAGANVIKIEPPHGEPGAGEPTRQAPRCLWRCSMPTSARSR